MNQQQTLNLMADRIEHVFAINRVTARVKGGTVTPRWIRFDVLPAIGERVARLTRLDAEIAVALNAESCRISRRGASLAVEIPRTDPVPVRLANLFQRLDAAEDAIPFATATLGMDDSGAPLLLRLPSPDVAHVLVAGTTGSGKTVLLQAMILSLARYNSPGCRGGLALLLVDPKHHAFAPFAGLPHLARPVISDTAETIEALDSLVHLMERRGVKTGDDHTIVAVVDELADILTTGGDPVRMAITRLTQRGREAGIHLVAATQKPTARVLGSLVKANFPTRLVGRVTSAEDARTASGWAGTGAERLGGRGDFLAVAEGRVTRFQSAYVSPDELGDQVTRIQANHGGSGVQMLSGREALARLVPIASSRETQVEEPSEETVLARRLTASDLWPERHKADGESYRWGFVSDVCGFLFDRPAQGAWYNKTRTVIELAEAMA
jgi:S-DNA-T family DNA segregation ATPase FtsK/SpoIIIE